MSKINMTDKKGFTLIELLLVTSIISLLSTVVMSAIGQARGEALLTVIGQETDSLNVEAQIYWTSRGIYTTGSSRSLAECPTSSDASWGFLGQSKTVDLIDSIKDRTGDVSANCAINQESWAVIFETNPSLASNDLDLIKTAHAQESDTGTVCIDSSKRLIVDIENAETSEGAFRAKKIRVRETGTGKFVCSASSVE